MNRRSIILVIISVVALIAISFIAYKQSVDKVAQPPYQSIDEAALQQQIQEIILMGNLSDCPSLSNIQYRLACEHFFATSTVGANNNLSNLKVVETKVLTEEEMREEMGEFFETLPKPVK